jgi:hypothetical protein
MTMSARRSIGSGIGAIAIAIAVATCRPPGDPETMIRLENRDPIDYVVQTIEPGMEDIPVTRLLSALATGRIDIIGDWSGTIRLLDRETCEASTEFRITKTRTNLVITDGRFLEVAESAAAPPLPMSGVCP